MTYKNDGEFTKEVAEIFIKARELFLKKNIQYSSDTNPLANFVNYAALRYSSDEYTGMFEAAKDFMGKHIANVYGHRAGEPKHKLDESLSDIMVYAAIMMYLERRARAQATTVRKDVE